MPPIRVEIEGHPPMEFPEGTDPKVIDMVVKRDVIGSGASGAAPEESPGFLARSNEALVKRGVNISNELAPTGSESFGDTLLKAPERALRVTGQAAGLFNDVMGEGVKSLYQTLMPDAAQEAIKTGVYGALDTSVGKSAMGAASKGAEIYGGLKKKYPNAIKDVEAMANIGAVIPIGKAAKAAAGGMVEGANIARDVVSITGRKTAKSIDKEIGETIKAGIQKGIRPTVVGKNTAGQAESYYKKAQQAVKDIVETMPDRLPKTLDEFSTAISDTKKDIYRQYSTMAGSAGTQGAMVDISPLRKEMASIIEQPNIRRSIKDSASKMLDELSAYEGAIDPATAEDLIASFNAETKAFWKNGNWNEVHGAAMKERVARQLRKEIDDSIEAYQGPGYQDLKRRYGALSAIEKEVSHRATVDLRKNNKGFFDLADIASAGEFALGLSRLDPSSMVAAVVMQGAKKRIKDLINPNRIIKKMFEDVVSLSEKKALAGTSYMPKSSTFRKTATPDRNPALTVPGMKSPQASALPSDIATPSYIRNTPALSYQGFELKGSPYDPRTVNAGIIERTRESLPKLYEGTKLPVGIDPELAREVNNFLIRGHFPDKTKFR